MIRNPGWALLAAVAAAGWAGGPQDGPAEAEFKKIRETIEKARTVKARFKTEGAAGGQKVLVSGSLLFKEGNKARLETRMVAGDLEIRFRSVSDGKKITVRSNLGNLPGPEEFAAFDGYADSLRRCLILLSAPPGQYPSAQDDPTRRFVAHDFKAGAEEGGAKTLSFTVTADGRPVELRLWYDPKTFALRKRTIEMSEPKVSLTETFEEFLLDAEVPDSEFAPASAPTAGDKAAAEILRKIQEPLEKARSARIRFKVEGNLGGGRCASTGTLLLREGNRARLESKLSAVRGEAELLVISSGKLLKGTTKGGSADMPFLPKVAEQDPPENLGAFLRAGMLHSATLTQSLFGEDLLPKPGDDPKKVFAVSNLASGEDGTLTYKLTVGRDSMTVRLWYDPKTFKPLKRTTMQEGFHFFAQFTETFEEYSLDVDLPDAPFDLPAPKGGAPMRTLSGRGGWIHCVAFSPDGTTLAAGTTDGGIKLWDPAGGRERATLTPGSPAQATVSLAFSPDGKFLAAASNDSALRVWDVAAGRERWKQAKLRSPVNSVRFSPDGKTIATGNGEDTVKLWDAAEGKEIAALRGHEQGIYALAFGSDGTLASGDHGGRIRLWDVAARKELRALPGHPRGISSMAFSPDGRTLASASHETKTVKLWDAAGGKELHTLWGHGGEIRAVAFSPDGKRLASGGIDKSLRIWDVATGKELVSFAGLESGVGAVAYSPDGRTLAASIGDRVRIWSLKDGEDK